MHGGFNVRWRYHLLLCDCPYRLLPARRSGHLWRAVVPAGPFSQTNIEGIRKRIATSGSALAAANDRNGRKADVRPRLSL